MGFYQTIAPHLATGARERLRQTGSRIGLALMVAVILYLMGQPLLGAVCLALGLVVQAVELVILSPFRRAQDPLLNARPARVLPALAIIFIMAASFSFMAFLVWRTGHPALATMGALALCGGLLNVIGSSIESRPLFLLGAAPYLATLAIMPLHAFMGGSPGEAGFLAIIVVVFALSATGVWRRTRGARLNEISALDEARARVEQAEAAMADRAAMAAIVSHELRTPVSAILAGAHVIRHGDQPEQTPQTADLIIDAGRLMTSMLNDLLDHSKIEARAMTLEARDFDLAAMLADTARFWSAPAAEKGLAFRLSGAPDEPVWLRGDPYRLRQILNNLISNAIKFTPQGEVMLEADVTPAGDARRLRLTVRDQGVGIAPDAMARLFSPFAQGSAEVARTYGGTGLGLTVSRDLARLMGGDLTAESERDMGAAFTLEVTLAAGDAVAEADPHDAPAPVLERRLRVLAVDDHEINRRTLGLVLQPLNVDLATASDGASALDILAAQPFDVVLMDVNMPGIDGNETTRRLRASDGINAGVPVIGFSAGTEADQIAACHAAGMTDWLPKPLEPARLYEALERALRTPAPAARDEHAA